MKTIKIWIEKWFRLFMAGQTSVKTEKETTVTVVEEVAKTENTVVIPAVKNIGKTVSPSASNEALVNNKSLTNNATFTKATEAMLDMEQFLDSQYDFRFNKLTEETEYRMRSTASDRFYPVGQRELNSFCIEARKKGIDCWDRDVSRYVFSDNIPEYHPFRFYMEELPKWDGADRVDSLARRVSVAPLWVKGFHRWMLGMAAQWLEIDRLHANSLSPVLVSRTQGKQKSTFCKMLLPDELQRYYTDSFDLSTRSGAERKLTDYGLINMDEFDKFSPGRMALLKNLMQVVTPSIRKAHQKNFRSLPRVASFIATSNQKELLTDPTGSRRFLCVEVKEMIDCSPIDYPQLYAQLKAELQAGQPYWFTSEEEAEIMTANESFYKRPVEEEVFRSCFRAPGFDENPLMLSAAEIFQRLKKYNPAAMSSVSATNFSKLLSSLGVDRKHTQFGNYYLVVAR